MEYKGYWPDLALRLERMGNDLDRIIERLRSIDRKLDNVRVELRTGFAEVKALLRHG